MVNKLKTMDTVFCLNIIVLKITKNKKTIETKKNASPKIFGCGGLWFIKVNKNTDSFKIITAKKER